MLGYAFMGKAHTNAFKKIPYIYWPPHARAPPRRASPGAIEDKVAQAARRYGYERHSTDWHDLINDPRSQVFDNGGPNDPHAEPCIAAARPASTSSARSRWRAPPPRPSGCSTRCTQAGVKHMCAFNYRFVPAIRLARRIIQEGRLGQIYHFRARYLQEWITDPSFPMVWRLDARTAGSGALGDLGIAHHRPGALPGGRAGSVSALTTTFITERDGGGRRHGQGRRRRRLRGGGASSQNGAVGTLEAVALRPGTQEPPSLRDQRREGHRIAFNLERLNELEVYLPEEGSGAMPPASARCW